MGLKNSVLRIKGKKIEHVIRYVQLYNSTHFIRTYANKIMYIKYKRRLLMEDQRMG